jgi:hypothetical protein
VELARARLELCCEEHLVHHGTRRDHDRHLYHEEHLERAQTHRGHVLVELSFAQT